MARPGIGPEVKTRISDQDAEILKARAARLGIDRSELIRRYVEAGLNDQWTDFSGRQLPTFAQILDRAAREVAEALDTLRSDWAPDQGPTPEQGRAYRDARRLLAQGLVSMEKAQWAETQIEH